VDGIWVDFDTFSLNRNMIRKGCSLRTSLYLHASFGKTVSFYSRFSIKLQILKFIKDTSCLLPHKYQFMSLWHKNIIAALSVWVDVSLSGLWCFFQALKWGFNLEANARYCDEVAHEQFYARVTIHLMNKIAEKIGPVAINFTPKVSIILLIWLSHMVHITGVIKEHKDAKDRC